MNLIEKPAGMESFLASGWLNFTIFTWEVNIGLTVEYAVDWVIDILNTIIEWINLIGVWLDDFRQEIVDIFNIIWEQLLLFLEDPIGYLINIFETYILPWAQRNIPFFATLYNWVINFRNKIEVFFEDFFETITYWITNFKGEVQAFFSDPLGYIEAKLGDIKGEFGLFFSDPIGYLKQKFEDYILNWVESHIPFLATLFILFTDYVDRIINFFTTDLWDWVIGFFNNPLNFLISKLEDWFWGEEAQ